MIVKSILVTATHQFTEVCLMFGLNFSESILKGYRSSSVCLVVTNNSSSIAVQDLIFSFLRASDKDKDLEQSDVIVCLEDSFADSRVENL